MSAEPGAGQQSPVGSIDKALLVLSVLAEAGPEGVGLVELAERLELHRATAHRTLAALRFRDFAVIVPETGRYVLGAAAAELGRGHTGHATLATRVGPALHALCQAAQELVHLGVLHAGHVTYLDKVEPARPVRVWSSVGGHRPAVLTALGRALLAAVELDRPTLAAYRALAGPAAGNLDLEGQIRLARERGYATEFEENEPGIACMGLALWENGIPVAAISITAPLERMSSTRVAELYTVAKTVLPPALPGTFHLVP